jgi:hypothetical protein
VINICEICKQNPCHPKCPNKIRRVRGSCEVCGENLYEDEYYYTDNSGGTYCSDYCARKANDIHEIEWEEDY